MKRSKLLVTGFGAFPGVPANLSEQLVLAWARQPPDWPFGHMRFEVLRTCYAGAGARVAELMREFSPDCTLMFGVANTPSTLRLERLALNLDDAAVADAAGDLRRGSAIVAGAPLALATRLDLGRVLTALGEAGVGNVEISNHAGTYVCNHAYYCALTAALALGGEVAFVHIPNPAEAASAVQRAALLQAVDSAARVLARCLAAALPGAARA